MLRVYLDQNKWVDLARALVGRPSGEPFRQVYAFALKAVQLGFASFPLSSTHYMETNKARDPERRRSVANAMLSLARAPKWSAPDTIASLADLLPCEIDRTLRKHFGRPLWPRDYPVFARGVNHAFGSLDSVEYEPPADWPIDDTTRIKLKRLGTSFLETSLLAGPPADIDEPPMDESIRALIYEELPSRYVKRRQHFKDLLQAGRLNKAKRADYLAADAFDDILDALNEAIARAGIRPSEFPLNDKQEMTAFLADIPSRNVEYQLNQQLHANQSYTPKLNDMLDMAALSIAIAYCDVVVTERQWVHLAKQSGVAERYGTTMLHDLQDLSGILLRHTDM